MRKKAGKYINYIVKFAQSPNKKDIVKELSAEIKNKGFLHGIQSLLHRKVHGKGTYNQANEIIPFPILKFDKRSKIVLPGTITPKVSIIIPMYHEVDFTLNCVWSIYINNIFTNYEIIIANDDPDDDTPLLKECFENIRIIKNKVNLGFLKNCNNAAKSAKGEYLVFLNNDTQVQKNWLSELLYVFENFSKAGLVGSKLVYPDGRLQEAGGIVWQDGSAWNYGNRDNPSKPEYNYVKEADYISGAAIMITRELWDEIGGFDENFVPAYYEDTDLCFEVRKKGREVIFQPFSVVVHFEGISHGTNLDSGIKSYQEVNKNKFLAKWHDELRKKSRNGEHVFSERDRTRGHKHVLVVDHYLPRIDKDAGSRCISNFIDSMLELGYNVKFLGENQVISNQYEKSFREKGVEVLKGSEFNFFDQSWKHYLKANLDNIEVVLLSRASVCAPIIAFLKSNNYKGNIIYFGHDLGYLRLEKEAASKNDAGLLNQAKRIKAAEDFMYQNADNSLVLSHDEIEYLRKYITKPIHYIPAYFFDVTREVAPYDKREGLLFVGGFNHPPNKDAMAWFLDEIYEPLHKQNISLTIVGSLMPKSITAYKHKFKLLNILSDISVDELNELYKKTRIAIVPLRYGAGVKGKVIEAMSKGVPVVGTDIAFEGMPKDDKFVCHGANTMEQMLSEIADVYYDEAKWKCLSEFGLKYVCDNFNEAKMKDVFKEIIG